jgi:uncharacterized protein (TIGR03067 family)
MEQSTPGAGGPPTDSTPSPLDAKPESAGGSASASAKPRLSLDEEQTEELFQSIISLEELIRRWDRLRARALTALVGVGLAAVVCVVAAVLAYREIGTMSTAASRVNSLADDVKTLGAALRDDVESAQRHAQFAYSSQIADFHEQLLSVRRTLEFLVEEALLKDRERLQGAWSCFAYEVAGKPTDEKDRKGIQLTIEGGKMTRTHGETRWVGTLTLDPTRKPRELDVTVTEGPNKGEMLRGVYDFQGELLLMCFPGPGGDRPRSLASNAENGCTLETWKREKP